MNTRLQVEHPVTELVTGLDLVRMQIDIANGEPLKLAQADVTLRGHAIECRIYAEDAENNFMPSPGRITQMIQPSGPGIREDCGVYAGWDVPLDYDPMLSKLVAYADTRERAIDRMRRALDEYVIGGIKTNLGLFRRILSDEDFQAGRIDTGFLERLLSATASKADPKVSRDVPDDIVALAAALLASARARGGQSGSLQPETSAWSKAGRLGGLRP